MKREDRCKSGAVPPLYMGAFCMMPLFFIGKAVKSVEHEPGDLPVFKFTMNYEDRRVFLA
jgi:hypothetical protein